MRLLLKLIYCVHFAELLQVAFNVALECRSVGGIQLHNRDVCLENRYRMVNRIDIVTSGHRVGLVFAPNTRQILRRKTLSKRRPETVRQSEAFLACHDESLQQLYVTARSCRGDLTLP